jgi:hypothetical protein
VNLWFSAMVSISLHSPVPVGILAGSGRRHRFATSPADPGNRPWLLSNVYRMVGFEYQHAERRSFAVGYYQRMLDALVAGDRAALVQHLSELCEWNEQCYSEKLRHRLGDWLRPASALSTGRISCQRC